MKTIFLTLSVLLLTLQAPVKFKTNDFNLLVGKKWTGMLTYLDYGNGKLQAIPTELSVTKSTKGIGVYDFTTSYPKEASHNSTDEVVIAKDGTRVDSETLKERTQLKDGSLKFITEKSGIDNEKKAIFRFTYSISKDSYTRKKEVCYEGAKEWFMRNELSLKSN